MVNHYKSFKPGDLVTWTFAKTSPAYNKENKYYFGILLTPEVRPIGSWIILLETGEKIHADCTEIDLI